MGLSLGTKSLHAEHFKLKSFVVMYKNYIYITELVIVAGKLLEKYI